MAETIRKIARFAVATGNLCLNLTCLHVNRHPKCACCRRGHRLTKK